MKTLFSRTLSIACFWFTMVLPPASAANILWTATPGQSTAWIVNGNWQGGAMPLAGDVAQFNNVGAATITYSMTHALNPTPNQANIGAIQLLSTRATNDLTISSNSASANTFYYHGQTINGIARTILANESTRNLTLTSSGSGYAQLGLTASLDSVIQVNSTGNVIINLPISGVNSRLVVRRGEAGSGNVTLQGTNSTYSGGTRIEGGGTLLVTANNAAGSGAITNAGGTLQIGANLSVTNSIFLTSETANYQRLFGAGNSYTVYSASGNLGAEETTAALLGGSAGGTRTLDSAFTATSLALNDTLRLGEVFNLTGTQGDIYAIQLSLNSVPAESSLGWLDGGEWINAVEGNSTTGSLAIQNFQGSFATSGTAATADYLGSWGYDSTANTVWAILDHSGSFSVLAIPEPSALVFLSAAGLLLIMRFRRNSHSYRRES